jgi:hypothetical protein
MAHLRNILPDEKSMEPVRHKGMPPARKTAPCTAGIALRSRLNYCDLFLFEKKVWL